MHEMSLAQSIADIAQEEAKAHTAKAVKRIMIEVGALSCVDAHALDFGFDAVTRGTALEGVKLTVTTVAAQAYCFDCEATVAVQHSGAACPECQSRKLVVTQGDDLKVKEMEIV